MMDSIKRTALVSSLVSSHHSTPNSDRTLSLDMDAFCDVVTSPRFLLACNMEGVDPVNDLFVTPLSELILLSRGDRDAARMRHKYLTLRRDALMDIITQRRSDILKCCSENGVEDSADLKINNETNDTTLSHNCTSSVKVKTSVDKLRNTIRLNEKWERKLELIEQAKLISNSDKLTDEKRRKKELDEKLRKKSVEARVKNFEIREQILRREAEALEEEQKERKKNLYMIIEAQEAEAERRRKKDLRLAQLHLQRDIHHRELRERQLEITNYSHVLNEYRNAALIRKLEHDEENRKRNNNMRLLALAERKLRGEERIKELKLKKEQCDLKQKEKEEVFRHKLEEEEKRFQNLKQARQYEYNRRCIEDAWEKKRAAVLHRHKNHICNKTEELQRRIEEENSKTDALREKRSQSRKARKILKEIEQEDKLFVVERCNRAKEYLKSELQKKIDAKFDRVNSINAEINHIVEERRRAQQATLYKRRAPVTSATPGPQTYSVLESEEHLRPIRGTRGIFLSGRREVRRAITPGPGQYIMPDLRKKRSAVLPPRNSSMHVNNSSMYCRSSSSHTTSASPLTRSQS